MLGLQSGKNMFNSSDFHTLVSKAFGNIGYSYHKSNHTIFGTPDNIYSLLEFIRDKCKFIMLLDICGVDNLKYPGSSERSRKRFECVYHLLNMEEHERLRVRVPMDMSEQLPSIVGLWKTAVWFEREV